MLEDAGIGTTDAAEEKPTEDFAEAVFCAVIIPLPPTPPDSAGNIEPSVTEGASFGSACLFGGRGHLPRLVVNSGEEETAPGTEANSVGAQADSVSSNANA